MLWTTLAERQLAAYKCPLCFADLIEHAETDEYGTFVFFACDGPRTHVYPSRYNGLGEYVPTMEGSRAAS